MNLPGEFYLSVGGSLETTNQSMEIRCPYDGRLVGRAPVAGIQHVNQALQAAEEIFPVFSEWPLHRRASLLEKTALLLENEEHIFAGLIALEAAKPYPLALTEVRRAILGLRTAAAECLRPPAEWMRLDWNTVGENMEGILHRFPRGIVLAISPFNFPLNLAVHKIAPALAVGCPVIAKPASATPLTLLHFGRLMVKAGWPPGTFSILNMPSSLAEQCAGDPRVAVISFTGSELVGWQLKEKFPRKKVILELGGNAGAFISSSADVEEALRSCLPAAFNYCGQVCIHLQRLFVAREHFPKVADAFVEYASCLTPTPPDHPDCSYSCMISESEAIRVETWVQEALTEGAIALTPLRRQGPVLSPVVLTKVRKGQKVMDEEAFGPVVCLEPVESFCEGLHRLNDTRFGLQAALFTNNLNEMNTFFRKVRAGNLLINRAPGFRVDPMPYGGIKQSGWGLEGIRYAMRSYTEERFCIKPFQ
ncbi:MAG: aldehyde dehydrogenase family protein [Flavobacteriales bacterium]|nr:aldehyde dehydrogenase family protein [Flavobacteriales bacterium]